MVCLPSFGTPCGQHRCCHTQRETSSPTAQSTASVQSYAIPVRQHIQPPRIRLQRPVLCPSSHYPRTDRHLIPPRLPVHLPPPDFRELRPRPFPLVPRSTFPTHPLFRKLPQTHSKYHHPVVVSHLRNHQALTLPLAVHQLPQPSQAALLLR